MYEFFVKSGSVYIFFLDFEKVGVVTTILIDEKVIVFLKGLILIDESDLGEN